ncbi:GntR family transcriptional regulator [uncultured Tateyamaria sp.]|uniref:GntR family transcriptional regulator n=1 Tax=Tateyamaria sp. 1078 TaxID=3417464 RepID=UPI0026132868|nr:GntR family transcriptional regulator [uncultured Tateyamaria sp.]
MDVFENIRTRAISGAFAHGEKLRAEVLRNDYGCSASTVREALLRLAALGLVEFQEQRGFRMPEYSEARQHDITQMRIMLETEGACRSMRYGGVAWESRLNAAHHKLSHIESRIAAMGPTEELAQLWMAAELEFHQTLLSACGSDLLIELHLQVYNRYRQIKAEYDHTFQHVASNIREHHAIVDAALSGDETAMRQRIFEHFERHLIPGRPVSVRVDALV